MEKPANFRFVNFIVTESHFSFKKEGPYALNVDISPSGQVNKHKKEFILLLDVRVIDKDEKFTSAIKAQSTFQFDEWDEEKLMPFLLTNAPAITFPFIRAYLANLTAQSALFTVILPTLNLSGMGQVLKEKLEFVD